MKKIYDLTFNDKKISVEIGEMAKQANGAVLVRYNDTVILSTAVASKKPKDLGFFPLMVVFEEKLYSVGKIPGGFLKREGRPSEHATLSSRLIDRPLRPLFPEGYMHDVQIINTVLSVDQEASPEMAALLGSSLALAISDIPLQTPVASVNVGRLDNKLVINPSSEEIERSDLDLIVAGTKDGINMVEAGANQVSEEDMLEAILFAHENIKQLIAFQEMIVAEIGQPKMAFEPVVLDPQLVKAVEAKIASETLKTGTIYHKQDKSEALNKIEDDLMDEYENKTYDTEEAKEQTLKEVKQIFHDVVKRQVRELITKDKIRPDGRQQNEIRPLDSQIDLLPRVHGSAMFTRGETQSLAITTLGALNEYQILDGISDDEQKRFMFHYNFPPFSVGETGRIGAPGRREVGHGALGERALAQVMPAVSAFPYTVRVVSEILESNGSSSQASICAGTMSLMTAGVPIKAPVAGIAMGLIMQDKDYTILSDIQGLEDHLGDMDFKVAGTKEGITALQMDIKINGINKSILEEALTQAKQGRLQILENMANVIAQPRQEVSEYAPKMATFKIDPDKIREVIGTGGKVINQIIEESRDVKIDIEDDGTVIIYHHNQEAIDHAKKMIEDIVKTARVGEVYDAKVVRIEKFGAFVQLFKGTDALLHISKIKHERVEKVEDALKIGDIIKVKVTDIDERGRINVSAKALIEKPHDKDTDKKEGK